MKKTAIILLNYNNAQETYKCINRLNDVGISKFDMIIIDNHSTDDSVSYLKHRCNEEKVIEARINGGYAAGNNLGIKMAEELGYQYVCVMNPDIYFETNIVEKMVHYLESNPDVGIVGPCLRHKDSMSVASAGGTFRMYRGKSGFNFVNSIYKDRGPLVVDYVSGGCIVTSTKNISRVGLIPEVYFLDYEDNEWCIMFKKMGYKVVCLTSEFAFHEEEGTIDNFSGLGTYFMLRNRVLFEKRNGTFFEKLICYPWIALGAIKNFIFETNGSDKKRSYKAYLDGFFNRNRYEYLKK